MDSQIKKKRTTLSLNIPKTPHNTSDDTTEESQDDDNHCSSPCCFFCIMKEQDATLRRPRIATCFIDLPHRDNEEEHIVLMLSELWRIAMTHPNDSEFPSLGIFHCMAKLIHKGINNRNWLLKNQNIYIPYYAAHIIGSYTMNKQEFAQIAVQSGVIPPLLELLRGKISWVEQRVAVRALGHLASYNSTFESVAEFEHEVVKLAMNLASNCLELIYVECFVDTRIEYHRNLLTRGIGGLEMENRRVEEWASQLQCWSLYLLNFFASKQRSLNLICKRVFLNDLCDMCGGLINNTSPGPGGVGLIRILCYTTVGRKSIADCPKVINSLCNLSRSCDDWQYIGIDCLVLLLKDPYTRYKVIDIAACYLVDLVELRSLGGKSSIGDTITKVLFLEHQNDDKVLQEVLVDLKVDRRKKEKLMSNKKLEEKRVIALLIKREANKMLRLGNKEEALLKYSEAVDVCPLRFRRERMKLYSNKAQCHILLKDPDSAISDSTRALCLSNPENTHGKSLWRRSQAYDIKGMGKESLMDCIRYMNCCIKSNETRTFVNKVPYQAMRMICKQMDATWIFARACSKSKVTLNSIHPLVKKTNEDEKKNYQIQNVEGNHEEQKKMMMGKTSLVPGLSTIIEEPFEAKEDGSRRKMERSESMRLKKAVVGGLT